MTIPKRLDGDFVGNEQEWERERIKELLAKWGKTPYTATEKELLKATYGVTYLN